MAGAFISKKRAVRLGGRVEVDSCLDETHTLSNTITDHPVEEGFNVTDHCRPDPERVQLRCFVSNTPLSEEQQSRAVRFGDVDFTTSAAQGRQIGAVDGRGNSAYTALKKMRDDGELVEVVTTLKTYGVSATEGMMIESISIPRTRENYDGLEFTISLKQVRIVRNRSTKQSKAPDTRARPKKTEGEVLTYGPPQRKQTLLLQGLQSTGVVR